MCWRMRRLESPRTPLHLKAVRTTISLYFRTITQKHRRNRIVCFLPSESNLSGPSLPDMLLHCIALRLRTLVIAEVPISNGNEQEHSFADDVDRSKLQEARTVDQKVGKVAHFEEISKQLRLITNTPPFHQTNHLSLRTDSLTLSTLTCVTSISVESKSGQDGRIQILGC